MGTSYFSATVSNSLAREGSLEPARTYSRERGGIGLSGAVQPKEYRRFIVQDCAGEHLEHIARLQRGYSTLLNQHYRPQRRTTSTFLSNLRAHEIRALYAGFAGLAVLLFTFVLYVFLFYIGDKFALKLVHRATGFAEEPPQIPGHLGEFAGPKDHQKQKPDDDQFLSADTEHKANITRGRHGYNGVTALSTV